MYTKTAFIFLWLALVSLGVCFPATPGIAAYDPSSQSWGAASITGAAGNVCTINRVKSGLGPLYPWVTCAFNTTTSTFTLTWAAGMFPLSPICDITPSGTPLVFYFSSDPTTSGAVVVDQTLLGLVSNGTFFITCR